MKLSDLTSADEVKTEVLSNPAVRAEWDRTAVAREVASRVVRYRVEHGLSQSELGAKLGVSQPYVARLESGDRSPTLATLARLAQRLGLEFHIDVTPTNVRISA
ncbi:MAG TPA: helix-turn-helix transcriptional regulator [Pseudonocardiaceae bacterium]|nr:helix-turn-helix transcriptional regulator [Pseudonocardiaceae bacterium]